MDKLEKLRSALWQVTPDEVKEQERVENQVGIIAQEVSDISSIPTITLSSLSSLDITSLGIGTSMGINGSWATIGSAGTGNYTINNSPNTFSTICNTSNNSLQVNGNAEFDGNIKWKGRDLGDFLQSIEDRLAIIQEPTSERLEKFAALKKAYDHYKLMEKLCHDDSSTTRS
jgi:hypothetical protein